MRVRAFVLTLVAALAVGGAPATAEEAAGTAATRNGTPNATNGIPWSAYTAGNGVPDHVPSTTVTEAGTSTGVTRSARTAAATPDGDARPFGACGVVRVDGLSFVDDVRTPVVIDDEFVVPVVDGDRLDLRWYDELGRLRRDLGDGGVLSLDLPSSALGAVRLVPDGDGVLVVVDIAGSGADNADVWLRHVAPDGTVEDPVVLDLDDDERLWDVVMTDAGLLLSLNLGTGPDEIGAVVRVVDGAPDPAFGIDGIAELPVQSQLLLGTHADRTDVIVWAFFTDDLVRLDEAGIVDTDFGTGGVLSFDAPSTTELDVAADGTMWLTGFGASGTEARIDRIDVDNPGGETDAHVTLPVDVDDFSVPGSAVDEDGDLVVTVRTGTQSSTVEFVTLVVAPDATVGSRADDVVFSVAEGFGSPTAATDASGRVLVHTDTEVRRVTAAGALDTICPEGDVGALRVAGLNRYETAALLSASAFPNADTVFVATGTSFPDALAGGPAAAAGRAPLLLVTPTAVPDATAAELTRLAPDRIVVLGGDAAVGPEVVDDLEAIAPVHRIAGANRYATAAGVSAETFDGPVERLYLATGESFPDALAVGPAAGARGVPILLSLPSRVPDVTLDEIERLDPAEIVIVGGIGAVSDAAEADLRRFYPGITINRVAGADRYNTARQVLLFERLGSTDAFPTLDDPLIEIAHLATGLSFPDALAAGPVAALEGASLLLTRPEDLSEVTRDALAIAAPSRVTILGGVGALSEETGSRITAAELGHRFLGYGNGVPLGWNRCQAITWLFNPTDMPEGGLEMLQEAFGRIEAITGLTFTYGGTTDEPLPSPQTGQRGPVDPQGRYGDAWSPLLVGWGTPSSSGAVGEATAFPVTADGFVSGTIVFRTGTPFPTDFSPDSWGIVALHEIGHIVALDHVPTEHVLYPAVGRWPLTDTTDGDNLGMRRATGPSCRNTPPRPSSLS